MRFTTSAALLLAIGTASFTGRAASAQAAAHPDLKWAPAPAVFPPGAEMAVLQGDPGAAAPFTVRLRFPAGYKIAPHTHPTDEQISVIAGAFRIGMGKTFDAGALQTLKVGGVATAGANQAHYAAAQGRTIVEIRSMGPFAMTYVNPADTPKVGATH